MRAMKTTTVLKAGLPVGCLLLALGCANRSGFAEETVPESENSPSSKLLLPKTSDDAPVRAEPKREARNTKTSREPAPEIREVRPVRETRVTADRAETVPVETAQVRREDDLIGDRPVERVSTDPGSTAPASKQLLEEMKPSGPLVTKSRQCYKYLAELKSNAEKISTGLDDGGKEVTLLIHISDELGTNVTDLADLWPENKTFVDYCAMAKRQSIILNEELARVPRNWRALRWSLNSALVQVSKLRHVARDLADAEPKPIATPGKDGKIEYSDPVPEALDPVLAKREAAVSEARRAREFIKKKEEEKAKKRMPTDWKNEPNAQ